MCLANVARRRGRAAFRERDNISLAFSAVHSRVVPPAGFAALALSGFVGALLAGAGTAWGTDLGTTLLASA